MIKSFRSIVDRYGAPLFLGLAFIMINAIVIYSIFIRFQGQFFGEMIIRWGLQDPYYSLFISLMAFEVFLVIIVILLFVSRESQSVTQVNDSIYHALSERKLNDAFDELFRERTLGSAIANVQKLLKLLRSFDQMKTSRVGVEASSIKAIMNDISEGIVLLDSDLFVKSINHKAETFLGLIPGEIVDHMFSRKVNHDVLFEHIQQALDDCQRVTALSIEYKKEPFSVDVIPITDQSEAVVRLVIVFKSAATNETTSSES